MAAGLTPKTPGDGWALRWTRQSVDLLLRDPVSHVLIAASTLLIGGVIQNLISEKGSVGLIMSVTVGQGVFGLVLLVMLAAVMQADQEKIGIDAENRRQIVVFCLIVVAFGIFLLSIAMMQTLAKDVEPDMFDPRSTLELAGKQVSRGLSVSVLSMLIVSPMWPALMLRFNAKAMNAWSLSLMMFMQMPNIYMSLAFMTFLAAGLAGALPFYIGIFVVAFWVAWIYVACREIFGGIDENAKVMQLKIAEV